VLQSHVTHAAPGHPQKASATMLCDRSASEQVHRLLRLRRPPLAESARRDGAAREGGPMTTQIPLWRTFCVPRYWCHNGLGGAMAKVKKVSLTTFVDFVSKSGTPKITVVRQFKNGDPYHPAFDFYKGVRDAIIDVHEHGKPKKALDAVLVGLNAKKVQQYTAVIRGHRKFFGKRTMKWFDPPTGVWSGGGVEVQVNPELGLEINGVPHLVKLYFKPEPLPKKNVPIIVRLMEKGLIVTSPVTLSVLDVRRGLLHAPGAAVPGLDGFLLGEALNFASIFASV
jgi:hypothetical protein